MVKDLGKLAIMLSAIGGLVWAMNSGPKYKIDNSKVKDGFLFFNQLVEYKKGGDKVRYADRGIEGEVDVIINGRRYDSDTTSQYQEGNKRYDYLMGKIYSMKSAKNDLRAQKYLERNMKKAEKRKERANRDLEVLRK